VLQSLERQVDMSADQARKADTYRKIKLGGLVIKGGLGDMPLAVILGAMIDAADRCKSDDERERLARLGDTAFNNGRIE
jgi:Conjugal transfer protein TraD